MVKKKKMARQRRRQRAAKRPKARAFRRPRTARKAGRKPETPKVNAARQEAAEPVIEAPREPETKPAGIKSKFYVKIENVVSFVTLGKSIPLNKLVSAVENAEYEPEQFPGLVYRTTEPRAAALIFSSGKIVCTGAKNIEKSKEAIKQVVDKIRKAGISLPRTYNVQVENIVASSKIRAKLNLEEITFSLENAEYEPEQFPGLVYRISEPRVAFLLFSSGKIICTGAHRIEDVYKALDKLKEKLESIGIKVTPVKD